jgi:hypothetical protein
VAVGVAAVEAKILPPIFRQAIVVVHLGCVLFVTDKALYLGLVEIGFVDRLYGLQERVLCVASSAAISAQFLPAFFCADAVPTGQRLKDVFARCSNKAGSLPVRTTLVIVIAVVIDIIVVIGDRYRRSLGDGDGVTIAVLCDEVQFPAQGTVLSSRLSMSSDCPPAHRQLARAPVRRARTGPGPPYCHGKNVTFSVTPLSKVRYHDNVM